MQIDLLSTLFAFKSSHKNADKTAEIKTNKEAFGARYAGNHFKLIQYYPFLPSFLKPIDERKSLHLSKSFFFREIKLSTKKRLFSNSRIFFVLCLDFVGRRRRRRRRKRRRRNPLLQMYPWRFVLVSATRIHPGKSQISLAFIVIHSVFNRSESSHRKRCVHRGRSDKGDILP